MRCIRKNNAEPAFLGYNGFPASICVSVNEELVHGIPGLRRLKNGDIVSIDVGVHYKGYYGDAAATFPVGKVSSSAAQLIEVTRESLNRAIKKAIPGNRLYDISYAVQSYVESQGFLLSAAMSGMELEAGCMRSPRCQILVCRERSLLEPRMVLAIGPMVSAGTWEVETLGDQWTVVTRDEAFQLILSTAWLF